MSIARISAVAAPLALILAFASGAVAQEEEAKAEAKTKATVTLAEKNESGITGKATIVEAAEAETPHAHEVKLELSGAAAGTYPAHIHRGTCDSGGGVATALASITVAETGEVASSSTVITPEQLAAADRPEGEAQAEAETEEEEMAMAGMMEEAGKRMDHGPLFIQVHRPDGAPAACGDLSHEGKGHGKKHEGEKGGR